jgi:hypothetical protein
MKELLDVFLLYIIPFGGGIPAGTLLANSRGYTWPEMTLIYFFSNLILIPIIEPVIHRVRRADFFNRIPSQFKTDFLSRMEKVGLRPDLFSLVVFAFGADVLSARVATLIAGHGFWSGWLITNVGNMIFFVFMMASTLWFNNLLGDGTIAAVIVMLLFIGVPALYRHLKRSAR